LKLSHLLPKNWVVRSPSNFAQGFTGTTAQNPEIFVKICPLVSKKFFETETIFSGSPFTGGPDAKILYLSTQRSPTAQNISSLQTFHFGDMGSKVQLFHLLPQKLGGQIPPYFAKGILWMTPKTLKIL